MGRPRAAWPHGATSAAPTRNRLPAPNPIHRWSSTTSSTMAMATSSPPSRLRPSTRSRCEAPWAGRELRKQSWQGLCGSAARQRQRRRQGRRHHTWGAVACLGCSCLPAFLPRVCCVVASPVVCVDGVTIVAFVPCKPHCKRVEEAARSRSYLRLVCLSHYPALLKSCHAPTCFQDDNVQRHASFVARTNCLHCHCHWSAAGGSRRAATSWQCPLGLS